MTLEGVDAIAFLQEDHRTIEQLLASLERSDAAAVEEAQVDAIAAAFAAHAATEERDLYPALADVDAGLARMAAESLEQHEEVREVLAELRAMSGGDAGYPQRLDALVLDLRRHLEREESEVFPVLRDAMPPDRLAELGARMRATRRAGESTAEPARQDHVHVPKGDPPSRPHPRP